MALTTMTDPDGILDYRYDSDDGGYAEFSVGGVDSEITAFRGDGSPLRFPDIFAPHPTKPRRFILADGVTLPT